MQLLDRGGHPLRRGERVGGGLGGGLGLAAHLRPHFGRGIGGAQHVLAIARDALHRILDVFVELRHRLVERAADAFFEVNAEPPDTLGEIEEGGADEGDDLGGELWIAPEALLRGETEPDHLGEQPAIGAHIPFIEADRGMDLPAPAAFGGETGIDSRRP